jgi:hypothetical protein
MHLVMMLKMLAETKASTEITLREFFARVLAVFYYVLGISPEE